MGNSSWERRPRDPREPMAAVKQTRVNSRGGLSVLTSKREAMPVAGPVFRALVLAVKLQQPFLSDRLIGDWSRENAASGTRVVCVYVCVYARVLNHVLCSLPCPEPPVLAPTTV